jgi:hypothetical protein
VDAARFDGWNYDETYYEGPKAEGALLFDGSTAPPPPERASAISEADGQ